MTNLEKIKITLCNTINAMSEDTLFEFLSEYEDDDNSYFPEGVVFTCEKCCRTYGKCNTDEEDMINYQLCQDRFKDFCNKECE